jgi:uncharacterized membrane protein
MWLLPLGILLLANFVYCGIKIKEDVSRKRRAWIAFGIVAALGAAAVLYWLGFIFLLTFSAA